MLSGLRQDGVPAEIPWLMTEFGYSVFAGRHEVDIEGALFHADTIGTFLAAGGTKAYIYGYEPGTLRNELKCSWGNLMMLQMPNGGQKLNRLSTYYTARLLASDWLKPGDGFHRIYPVIVDPTETPVTAYAVHRPDKQWALLAINKDPNRSAQLAIRFRASDRTFQFVGEVTITQFSREQYRWQDDGENGRPILSNPSAQSRCSARGYYELPPYSVSVLRGKVAQ
jgi:hypothetical protein